MNGRCCLKCFELLLITVPRNKRSESILIYFYSSCSGECQGRNPHCWLACTPNRPPVRAASQGKCASHSSSAPDAVGRAGGVRRNSPVFSLPRGRMSPGAQLAAVTTQMPDLEYLHDFSDLFSVHCRHSILRESCLIFDHLVSFLQTLYIDMDGWKLWSVLGTDVERRDKIHSGKVVGFSDVSQIPACLRVWYSPYMCKSWCDFWCNKNAVWKCRQKILVFPVLS